MASAAAAVRIRSRTRGRAAPSDRWLFRLALAATISTYLLIVAGATVRVTGSGLGCPDWPTCHGRLFPPLEVTALIEYTHRLIGAVASPLILAVPVGAWLARRGRYVLAPALALPVLLSLQIVLGAIVVRLELPPMAVLVHLGFAMLILGGLVWVTALEAPVSAVGPPPARGRLLGPLAGLAALTFVLLLTGAYTRAVGASIACIGFPGCDVPEAALQRLGESAPSRLVAIHLAHRGLAYVTAALGAGIAVAVLRRRTGGQRGAAWALLAALAAQVLTGAAAVSTGLPAVLRGAHVAGAAAVWALAMLSLALEARRAWALEAKP
ncbi:MAG TPA: COX15/CtaA family protein [Chloroflexota bacterium]|nr:COX15/CtaA family protein [Chloroflexota bacterium]